MFLKEIKIKNLTIKSNIFIAPLAGYTNLPTRLIYRKLHAGICYTEMISAEGILRNFDKSVEILKTNDLDKPLGIQIFGDRAERIQKACEKLLNFDFDLIDLNCGCSIKKVIKQNAGVCLIKDPEKIYNIIKLLTQITEKPITLKIRSGWDEKNINFLETLDAACKGGASLITFHPRTKSQMFNGKANWEYIKIMKEKSPIPVIGNGDIFTVNDAIKIIQDTKCDGIMLARGVIENPFLIRDIYYAYQNCDPIETTLKERIDTLLLHCKSIIDYYGEKKGIKEFRKFFKGYLKGFPEISKLKEKINYIEEFSLFEKEVLDYYKKLL